MPRSKVLDSLWMEAASVFEDIVKNAQDEATLPTVDELQSHQESLQELIDIFSDAGQVQAQNFDQPSESAPAFITKASYSKKRPFAEVSNSEDGDVPAPILPHNTSLTADDDKYIWDSYLKCVESNANIRPNQIAQKLGTNVHAVSYRLKLLQIAKKQEETCKGGYWSASDAEAESASGGVELVEPPLDRTPRCDVRKCTFTRSDDVLIWNTYIRDGCEIHLPHNYVQLSRQLHSRQVESIRNRLVRLAIVDQGLPLDQVRLSLFAAAEDEHILTADSNNRKLAQNKQLSEDELSTTLGKVLHREPVRVLYRLRKLLAQREAHDRFRQFETKAWQVRSRTETPGRNALYTAEEDDLLIEVDRTYSHWREKNIALAGVARGLGRTVTGLKHHLGERLLLGKRAGVKEEVEDGRICTGDVGSTSADNTCDVNGDSCKGSCIGNDGGSLQGRAASTKSDDGISSISSASNGITDTSPLTKRCKRGVGYAYTDAELAIVWGAYCSTDVSRKRTAAVKQAAVQIGRSYNSVAQRLQRMKYQGMNG